MAAIGSWAGGGRLWMAKPNGSSHRQPVDDGYLVGCSSGGRGRGLVRKGGVEEVRWMRKDERSTENNKKIIRSLLTGID